MYEKNVYTYTVLIKMPLKIICTWIWICAQLWFDTK